MTVSRPLQFGEETSFTLPTQTPSPPHGTSAPMLALDLFGNPPPTTPQPIRLTDSLQSLENFRFPLASQTPNAEPEPAENSEGFLNSILAATWSGNEIISSFSEIRSEIAAGRDEIQRGSYGVLGQDVLAEEDPVHATLSDSEARTIYARHARSFREGLITPQTAEEFIRANLSWIESRHELWLFGAEIESRLNQCLWALTHNDASRRQDQAYVSDLPQLRERVFEASRRLSTQIPEWRERIRHRKEEETQRLHENLNSTTHGSLNTVERLRTLWRVFHLRKSQGVSGEEQARLLSEITQLLPETASLQPNSPQHLNSEDETSVLWFLAQAETEVLARTDLNENAEASLRGNLLFQILPRLAERAKNLERSQPRLALSLWSQIQRSLYHPRLANPSMINNWEARHGEPRRELYFLERRLSETQSLPENPAARVQHWISLAESAQGRQDSLAALRFLNQAEQNLLRLENSETRRLSRGILVHAYLRFGFHSELRGLLQSWRQRSSPASIARNLSGFEEWISIAQIFVENHRNSEAQEIFNQARGFLAHWDLRRRIAAYPALLQLARRIENTNAPQEILDAALEDLNQAPAFRTIQERTSLIVGLAQAVSTPQEAFNLLEAFLPATQLRDFEIHSETDLQVAQSYSAQLLNLWNRIEDGATRHQIANRLRDFFNQTRVVRGNLSAEIFHTLQRNFLQNRILLETQAHTLSIEGISNSHTELSNFLLALPLQERVTHLIESARFFAEHGKETESALLLRALWNDLENTPLEQRFTLIQQISNLRTSLSANLRESIRREPEEERALQDLVENLKQMAIDAWRSIQISANSSAASNQPCLLSRYAQAMIEVEEGNEPEALRLLQSLLRDSENTPLASEQDRRIVVLARMMIRGSASQHFESVALILEQVLEARQASAVDMNRLERFREKTELLNILRAIRQFQHRHSEGNAALTFREAFAQFQNDPHHQAEAQYFIEHISRLGGIEAPSLMLPQGALWEFLVAADGNLQSQEGRQAFEHAIRNFTRFDADYFQTGEYQQALHTAIEILRSRSSAEELWRLNALPGWVSGHEETGAFVRRLFSWETGLALTGMILAGAAGGAAQGFIIQALEQGFTGEAMMIEGFEALQWARMGISINNTVRAAQFVPQFFGAFGNIGGFWFGSGTWDTAFQTGGFNDIRATAVDIGPMGILLAPFATWGAIPRCLISSLIMPLTGTARHYLNLTHEGETLEHTWNIFEFLHGVAIGIGSEAVGHFNAHAQGGSPEHQSIRHQREQSERIHRLVEQIHPNPSPLSERGAGGIYHAPSEGHPYRIAASKSGENPPQSPFAKGEGESNTPLKILQALHRLVEQIPLHELSDAQIRYAIREALKAEEVHTQRNPETNEHANPFPEILHRYLEALRRGVRPEDLHRFSDFERPFDDLIREAHIRNTSRAREQALWAEFIHLERLQEEAAQRQIAEDRALFTSLDFEALKRLHIEEQRARMIAGLEPEATTLERVLHAANEWRNKYQGQIPLERVLEAFGVDLETLPRLEIFDAEGEVVSETREAFREDEVQESSEGWIENPPQSPFIKGGRQESSESLPPFRKGEAGGILESSSPLQLEAQNPAIEDAEGYVSGEVIDAREDGEPASIISSPVTPRIQRPILTRHAEVVVVDAVESSFAEVAQTPHPRINAEVRSEVLSFREAQREQQKEALPETEAEVIDVEGEIITESEQGEGQQQGFQEQREDTFIEAENDNNVFNPLQAAAHSMRSFFEAHPIVAAAAGLIFTLGLRYLFGQVHVGFTEAGGVLDWVLAGNTAALLHAGFQKVREHKFILRPDALDQAPRLAEIALDTSDTLPEGARDRAWAQLVTLAKTVPDLQEHLSAAQYKKLCDARFDPDREDFFASRFQFTVRRMERGDALAQPHFRKGNWEGPLHDFNFDTAYPRGKDLDYGDIREVETIRLLRLAAQGETKARAILLSWYSSRNEIYVASGTLVAPHHFVDIATDSGQDPFLRRLAYEVLLLSVKANVNEAGKAKRANLEIPSWRELAAGRPSDLTQTFFEDRKFYTYLADIFYHLHLAGHATAREQLFEMQTSNRVQYDLPLETKRYYYDINTEKSRRATAELAFQYFQWLANPDNASRIGQRSLTHLIQLYNGLRRDFSFDPVLFIRACEQAMNRQVFPNYRAYRRLLSDVLIDFPRIREEVERALTRLAPRYLSEREYQDILEWFFYKHQIQTFETSARPRIQATRERALETEPQLTRANDNRLFLEDLEEHPPLALLLVDAFRAACATTLSSPRDINFLRRLNRAEILELLENPADLRYPPTFRLNAERIQYWVSLQQEVLETAFGTRKSKVRTRRGRAASPSFAVVSLTRRNRGIPHWESGTEWNTPTHIAPPPQPGARLATQRFVRESLRELRRPTREVALTPPHLKTFRRVIRALEAGRISQEEADRRIVECLRQDYVEALEKSGNVEVVRMTLEDYLAERHQSNTWVEECLDRNPWFRYLEVVRIVWKADLDQEFLGTYGLIGAPHAAPWLEEALHFEAQSISDRETYLYILPDELVMYREYHRGISPIYRVSVAHMTSQRECVGFRKRREWPQLLIATYSFAHGTRQHPFAEVLHDRKVHPIIMERASLEVQEDCLRVYEAMQGARFFSREEAGFVLEVQEPTLDLIIERVLRAIAYPDYDPLSSTLYELGFEPELSVAVIRERTRKFHRYLIRATRNHPRRVEILEEFKRACTAAEHIQYTPNEWGFEPTAPASTRDMDRRNLRRRHPFQRVESREKDRSRVTIETTSSPILDTSRAEQEAASIHDLRPEGMSDETLLGAMGLFPFDGARTQGPHYERAQETLLNAFERPGPAIDEVVVLGAGPCRDFPHALAARARVRLQDFVEQVVRRVREEEIDGDLRNNVTIELSDAYGGILFDLLREAFRLVNQVDVTLTPEGALEELARLLDESDFENRELPRWAREARVGQLISSSIMAHQAFAAVWEIFENNFIRTRPIAGTIHRFIGRALRFHARALTHAVSRGARAYFSLEIAQEGRTTNTYDIEGRPLIGVRALFPEDAIAFAYEPWSFSFPSYSTPTRVEAVVLEPRDSTPTANTDISNSTDRVLVTKIVSRDGTSHPIELTLPPLERFWGNPNAQVVAHRTVRGERRAVSLRPINVAPAHPSVAGSSTGKTFEVSETGSKATGIVVLYYTPHPLTRQAIHVERMDPGLWSTLTYWLAAQAQLNDLALNLVQITEMEILARLARSGFMHPTEHQVEYGLYPAQVIGHGKLGDKPPSGIDFCNVRGLPSPNLTANVSLAADRIGQGAEVRELTETTTALSPKQVTQIPASALIDPVLSADLLPPAHPYVAAQANFRTLSDHSPASIEAWLEAAGIPRSTPNENYVILHVHHEDGLSHALWVEQYGNLKNPQTLTELRTSLARKDFDANYRLASRVTLVYKIAPTHVETPEGPVSPRIHFFTIRLSSDLPRGSAERLFVSWLNQMRNLFPGEFITAPTEPVGALVSFARHVEEVTPILRIGQLRNFPFTTLDPHFLAQLRRVGVLTDAQLQRLTTEEINVGEDVEDFFSILEHQRQTRGSTARSAVDYLLEIFNQHPEVFFVRPPLKIGDISFVGRISSHPQPLTTPPSLVPRRVSADSPVPGTRGSVTTSSSALAAATRSTDPRGPQRRGFAHKLARPENEAAGPGTATTPSSHPAIPLSTRQKLRRLFIERAGKLAEINPEIRSLPDTIFNEACERACLEYKLENGNFEHHALRIFEKIVFEIIWSRQKRAHRAAPSSLARQTREAAQKPAPAAATPSPPPEPLVKVSPRAPVVDAPPRPNGEAGDRRFLRPLEALSFREYHAFSDAERRTCEQELFAIIRFYPAEHTLSRRAKGVLAQTHWNFFERAARRKTSGKKQNTAFDQDDLVQEAALAMVEEAIERFDPEKGNLFSTYLKAWIFEAQSRHIKEMERAVRIPRYVYELFPKVSELEALDKNDREICEALEITQETLEKIRRHRQDPSFSSDQFRKLTKHSGELIEGETPEVSFYGHRTMSESFDPAQTERYTALQRALEKIPPRQADVFIQRFVEGRTLADIAKNQPNGRVTPQRIQDIQTRAIKNLRKVLRNKVDADTRRIIDGLIRTSAYRSASRKNSSDALSVPGTSANSANISVPGTPASTGNTITTLSPGTTRNTDRHGPIRRDPAHRLDRPVHIDGVRHATESTPSPFADHNAPHPPLILRGGVSAEAALVQSLRSALAQNDNATPWGHPPLAPAMPAIDIAAGDGFTQAHSAYTPNAAVVHEGTQAGVLQFRTRENADRPRASTRDPKTSGDATKGNAHSSGQGSGQQKQSGRHRAHPPGAQTHARNVQRDIGALHRDVDRVYAYLLEWFRTPGEFDIAHDLSDLARHIAETWPEAKTQTEIATRIMGPEHAAFPQMLDQLARAREVESVVATPSLALDLGSIATANAALLRDPLRAPAEIVPAPIRAQRLARYGGALALSLEHALPTALRAEARPLVEASLLDAQVGEPIHRYQETINAWINRFRHATRYALHYPDRLADYLEGKRGIPLEERAEVEQALLYLVGDPSTVPEREVSTLPTDPETLRRDFETAILSNDGEQRAHVLKATFYGHESLDAVDGHFKDIRPRHRTFQAVRDFFRALYGPHLRRLRAESIEEKPVAAIEEATAADQTSHRPATARRPRPFRALLDRLDSTGTATAEESHRLYVSSKLPGTNGRSYRTLRTVCESAIIRRLREMLEVDPAVAKLQSGIIDDAFHRAYETYDLATGDFQAHAVRVFEEMVRAALPTPEERLDAPSQPPPPAAELVVGSAETVREVSEASVERAEASPAPIAASVTLVIEHSPFEPSSTIAPSIRRVAATATHSAYAILTLHEGESVPAAITRALRIVPGDIQRIQIETTATRREMNQWPDFRSEMERTLSSRLGLVEISIIRTDGSALVIKRTREGVRRVRRSASRRSWLEPASVQTRQTRVRLAIRGVWREPTQVRGNIIGTGEGQINHLSDLLRRAPQILHLANFPQVLARLEEVAPGLFNLSLLMKYVNNPEVSPELPRLQAFARILEVDVRDLMYLASRPHLAETPQLRDLTLSDPAGPYYAPRLWGTFAKVAEAVREKPLATGFALRLLRFISSPDRPLHTLGEVCTAIGFPEVSSQHRLLQGSDPSYAAVVEFSKLSGEPVDEILEDLNRQHGAPIRTLREAGYPTHAALSVLRPNPTSRNFDSPEKLREFAKGSATQDHSPRFRAAYLANYRRERRWPQLTLAEVAGRRHVKPDVLGDFESIREIEKLNPYFTRANIHTWIDYFLFLETPREEIVWAFTPTAESADMIAGWLEERKIYPDIAASVRAKAEELKGDEVQTAKPVQTHRPQTDPVQPQQDFAVLYASERERQASLPQLHEGEADLPVLGNEPALVRVILEPAETFVEALGRGLNRISDEKIDVVIETDLHASLALPSRTHDTVVEHMSAHPSVRRVAFRRIDGSAFVWNRRALRIEREEHPPTTRAWNFPERVLPEQRQRLIVRSPWAIPPLVLGREIHPLPSENTLSCVGDLLLHWRKALDISQKEAAARLSKVSADRTQYDQAAWNLLETRVVRSTLHRPQILRDLALLLHLPLGHVLYLFLLPLLRDPAVHRYCAEQRRAGPLHLNPQTRVLRDLTAEGARAERALPLLMAEALGDPDRLLDSGDFAAGAGISIVTFLGIYEGKGVHTTGDRKMVYPTLDTLQRLAYAAGRFAEHLIEAVNTQRDLIRVIEQINARAAAPFQIPRSIHLDVHENTDARKLREYAAEFDAQNARHFFALYHFILRRTHFTEVSYRELEALWNMAPPQIEQFEALEYTSAKAKGVAYRADRIERWIAHSLRLHGKEEIIIWILAQDPSKLREICNHLDAQGLYANIVAALRPQIPPPLIRIEVVSERVKLSPPDEAELQTRIQAQRERMQRLPSLLDGELDVPALGEHPSMTRILVEGADYVSALDRAGRFIPNSTKQLFVEVDLSAERTRREILPTIGERHWPREIREVRVIALGGVAYVSDLTKASEWQLAGVESRAWEAASPKGSHRLLLRAPWEPPRSLYGMEISLDPNASGAIRGLPDLLVEIRRRLGTPGRPLPQGELGRRIHEANDGPDAEGSQGMISKIESARTTDLPSLQFLTALARIAPGNSGQVDGTGLDPRDVVLIAMLPKLRDPKVREAALSNPEGPTYYGRTRGTFEKLASHPSGPFGIGWVVYSALREIDRPLDVDAYAERSGLSRTSLGSLLGTVDQPTLATIDRLAYYLGWPRERLIVAINYQRGLIPLIDAINDAGFPMEYSLLIGPNQGGDVAELRRFAELGAQYTTDVRTRLALSHWTLRRQTYPDRTAGDLAETWNLTPRQLEQLESPVWAGPYEGGIRFDAENLPRFIEHSLRLGRAHEEVAEDLSPTLERAEEMVAWLESEKVYPELVIVIRARIEAMQTPPLIQDRLTKPRKAPRAPANEPSPRNKNPEKKSRGAVDSQELRDRNLLKSLPTSGRAYVTIPIPERLAFEKEIFRIIREHPPEHPLALLAKEVLARTHWNLLMQEARRRIKRVREGAAIDAEDLVQEAAAALLKSAIPKFDPTLNNLFSTYLKAWIKQTQKRHVDDLARTIRIPVHLHEDAHEVRVLIREGKTDKQICDFLEISPEKLKEIKSQMHDNTVSADAPRRLGNSDDESDLYAVLSEADALNPEDQSEQDERRALVQKALDLLDPRQAEILRRRFWKEETLEEVSANIPGQNADSVTRERVRQLERKALQRLKRILITRFKVQPKNVLGLLAGRLPAIIVGFGGILGLNLLPANAGAQPLHDPTTQPSPSWMDTWTSPGHILLLAAVLTLIPTVATIARNFRNGQNPENPPPPSSSRRFGGLWRRD